MIHFIFPEDNSTTFLATIVERYKAEFGDEALNLIRVEPVAESYEEIIAVIKALPPKSKIVFLGHGYSDRLCGVFEETGATSLVEINRMDIFSDKHLFALACNSSELLMKSYSRSSILTSIGFGDLPTDKVEITKKKYVKAGVTQDTLIAFKDVIVDCVSKSIIEMQRNQRDMEYLYSHLKLLLNKAMADAVLISKNRPMANLIFVMNDDSVFLKS